MNLNHIEQAKQYIDESYDLIKHDPFTENDYGIYHLLCFDYAIRTNQEQIAQENLDIFIRDFIENDRSAEDDMSIIQIIEDLQKRNRVDDLVKLKPIVEQILEGELPSSQRITLYQYLYQLEENKKSDNALSLMNQMIQAFNTYTQDEKKAKIATIDEFFSRSEELKKIDQWVEYANQDMLTKLWNRRYFRQVYRDRIETDHSYAIGIIDIDYFKEYNDNYGHNAGDKVLQSLANLFKSHSDDNFIFARYGGDEFVLFAIDIDEQTIISRMESLQNGLKDLNLEHEYSKCSDRISISVGIAYDENAEEIKELEEIIEVADQLLYQVKVTNRSSFKIGHMIHDKS